MSDYEVCETGLWVDGDGKVVTSAPEGPGRQLVPPGGQMRPDRVKAVEAARAAAPAKKAPAKKAAPKAEG